jgi:hypothetical protein
MKKTMFGAALLAHSLALTLPADAQRRARDPNAPPPGPTPRSPEGRALLQGASPADKGVWTPRFGITDPIKPVAELPWQPWSKALFTARQSAQLEPHTRCKPSGSAREFLTPYGVEFLEASAIKRLFIFDIGGPHTFRTVYMDGRSHPRDLVPTYYGHSIGWWEGDTLVIDTVGYNEGFWMDRRGLPSTEQMHTVERFTRVNHDAMKYEITVDDPGAYTQPWTTTFNLGWEDGTELYEYICQEANYATELMVGEKATSVDRTSPIVP